MPVISCPGLRGTKCFLSRPLSLTALESSGRAAYPQWGKVAWTVPNAVCKTAHSKLQMCSGSKLKLLSEMYVMWLYLGGGSRGRREEEGHHPDVDLEV